MYQNITMNELHKLLGNISLIDVRETYEYNAGHIPTSMNIPFQLLKSAPYRYLKKNNIYYIVCQSGIRSARACEILSRAGYTVINVLEGTSDWSGKLV